MDRRVGGGNPARPASSPRLVQGDTGRAAAHEIDAPGPCLWYVEDKAANPAIAKSQ